MCGLSEVSQSSVNCHCLGTTCLQLIDFRLRSKHGANKEKREKQQKEMDVKMEN